MSIHATPEDPSMAEELLPLVYDQLRALAAARLAREFGPQTLQPTALVHEAYVRLVKGGERRRWQGRRQFFLAAAEAMRRILINRARDKKRIKRGGAFRRLNLDPFEIPQNAPPEELLALDEAMERLADHDPVSADLVRLVFFAGLNLDDSAEVLGVSSRTADRRWAYARAWLFRQLSPEGRARSVLDE